MYDVHLRLIGKRVVEFLLLLTKLFFARCYGWYERISIKNRRFRSTRISVTQNFR